MSLPGPPDTGLRLRLLTAFCSTLKCVKNWMGINLLLELSVDSYEDKRQRKIIRTRETPTSEELCLVVKSCILKMVMFFHNIREVSHRNSPFNQ